MNKLGVLFVCVLSNMCVKKGKVYMLTHSYEWEVELNLNMWKFVHPVIYRLLFVIGNCSKCAN